MSLLSTCLSARMQLINVRKYGQYETCGRYVNEFTTCLLLASKVRSGAITQEQMDVSSDILLHFGIFFYLTGIIPSN